MVDIASDLSNGHSDYRTVRFCAILLKVPATNRPGIEIL